MKKIDNINDINNMLKEKNIQINNEDKNKCAFTITKEVEEFDKLKTKILKYIMYKKRTENEIRQKFTEEDENMVEDAIEYFKELKYIDDLIYIDRAITEYIALKNLSIKELKYKLLSKGLNKNDIEQYFSLNSEKLLEYEFKSVKNIINKKIKKDELDTIKNYLYKKGYLSEIINKALEEIEEIED